LLDEGVVPDAADVDTALILGAGFPFWLGGITKRLDRDVAHSPKRDSSLGRV
jgi:hypothetical protein